MIEIPGIGPACRAVQDADEGDIFTKVVECLARNAEQLELRAHALHLATELAASCDASARDRALVALGAALVWSGIALGSTGRAMDGAARGWVANALDPVLIDELGGDAVGAIAALAHAGADPFGNDGGAPLVLDGDWLTTGRMRAAEDALAADLTSRAGELKGEVSRVAEALADVQSRPTRVGNEPVHLHADQARAVSAACSRRLCVVSGGPGTGKTSIVVAVLRVLVRLGVDPGDVALAAPTGKAAQRMTEAVAEGLARVVESERSDADRALIEAAPEARTLHRLLGYRPHDASFTWHRRAPLDARVVVIDEGSMVPLEHMKRLVDALRPDARLVVLGDADQLPSVAAGAVFRDLVASLPGAAVRLTQSYRMRQDDERGLAILGAANAVNIGDGGPLLEAPVRTGATLVRWHGVERIAPDGWAGLLARWFDEGPSEAISVLRAPLTRTSDGLDEASSDAVRAALAHHSAGRVLCVTRRMARGADDVNRRLRAMALAQVGMRATSTSPIAGEPVIVRSNDYELGLFNGDQGVVVTEYDAASGAVVPRVAFVRGARVISVAMSRLDGMTEPGYALTVHRAQGSEYDRIVLALPDQDSPLLTREIVYTALTRARHAALIVGSEDQLVTAVSRDAGRRTGLQERIGALGTGADLRLI